MNAIKLIIKKLTEAGCAPAQNSSGWQSRCPAHDDSQPSLSVSESDDGKVLLRCHAGCTTEKIVAGIGLTMADLFPARAPKAGETAKAKCKKKGHVFPTLDEAAESVRLTLSKALHGNQVTVSRHIYCDAEGRELLAVVRYEPDTRDGSKTCRPFHAAEGGWSIGDPEGLLPIYRLADVKAGTGRVFVVEGEPCAEAGSSIGLVCTTSAHGSQSAKKTDWSPLAGRDVVILPDNDEPGMMYAADVARILTRLNPSGRVRIVSLPDATEAGDDIVNYIKFHQDKPADEVRSMIEALADATPVWADDTPVAEIMDSAPEEINRPLRLIGGRAYLVTWVHVQSGTNQAMKRVVLRSDGKYYAEEGVPGALPFSDLGLKVKLPTAPHRDSLLSGAGLKSFAAGVRPDPADVLKRVRGVIEHFMDFAHSVGTQSDLVDMVACYTMSSYLLDAFSVVGYLWPNADKGSGKTKLLAVVTGMGCMGVLVTAGGTFASLRDLADYGAVLGFDDAENIMDTRKVDPDKRTLLLAGNRKGSYVTLKEPFGDGWTTRYVHVFCPRLFSAIGLPDETLGSRTIVVPLLRSSDNTKSNRDPADTDCWPTNRRALLDDLWLTGLANLSKLAAYDRRAAALSPLCGRLLEPWRNILAVALWLQTEHGVNGMFDRMSALSVKYQRDRSDIEEASPVRIMILALYSILATEKAGTAEFTPTQVADAMNFIARETELDYVGDSFINARKAGRLLQRLRFERAQRIASGKRWMVVREDLDALARAYGIEPPDTSGVGCSDECRCVVSAVDAVTKGTHVTEINTALRVENPSTKADQSTVIPITNNDLDWEGGK